MQPVTYSWIKSDTQAICLPQPTNGPEFLKLDGFIGSGYFPTFSRTVSLTAANDESAIDFTIKGIYQGQFVSETIAGPNANTVETTHFFDQVQSVFVDFATIGNVSVGIGLTGHTHWFVVNLVPFVNFMSVQLILDDGTIDYSFVVTNQEVRKTIEFSDLNILDNVIGNMTNANSTQFGFDGGAPFVYGAIKVNTSDNDTTFRVTILQMGDGGG